MGQRDTFGGKGRETESDSDEKEGEMVSQKGERLRNNEEQREGQRGSEAQMDMDGE